MWLVLRASPGRKRVRSTARLGTCTHLISCCCFLSVCYPLTLCYLKPCSVPETSLGRWE